MGIEEQIDRLIDLGEDIKSRLDLLFELASDHFAGADKMVVEEPAKKWRILEPGEVVCSGDRVNAKSNPPSDPPHGFGWRPVDASVGTSVCQDDPCVFARLVADEPAKEPEPAWEPKVGDWVRVTRPERPEISDDTPWLAEMDRFDGKVMQVARFWEIYKSLAVILAGTNYAFKVDWLAPADAPANELVDHLAVPRISPGEWLDIRDAYRDVTPADVGKLVYVRNGDLEPWIELRLAEVTGADFPYRCTKDGLDPTMWQAFRYAIIRNERPAKSEVGDGYRHPMHIDLGEQCEFSDGSTNPDGSLVWGIFARLMLCKKDLESNAIRYYTEDGTYYHHCRVKVEG